MTERSLKNANAARQSVIKLKETAQAELIDIMCTWHGWNCKSRAACGKTNKRKLDEKNERIWELEDDIERCRQGMLHGH